MNTTQATKNFEILIGGDKTTLRLVSIDGVADYLRPGRPDVVLAKRGYTTWQVRSGGRIIGSVQQMSGF